MTIAFSPIHDIAPGIDSDGMNRAPIYPVGDTMQSISAQGRGGVEQFNNVKKEVDAVLDTMISKSSIKNYT